MPCLWFYRALPSSTSTLMEPASRAIFSPSVQEALSHMVSWIRDTVGIWLMKRHKSSDDEVSTLPVIVMLSQVTHVTCITSKRMDGSSLASPSISWCILFRSNLFPFLLQETTIFLKCTTKVLETFQEHQVVDMATISEWKDAAPLIHLRPLLPLHKRELSIRICTMLFEFFHFFCTFYSDTQYIKQTWVSSSLSVFVHTVLLPSVLSQRRTSSLGVATEMVG